MSSDYEFSDDEDYNEYDDDEEAMDVEGGLSYISLSVVPNNLILAHFPPK
jgi:hypothetical protein